MERGKGLNLLVESQRRRGGKAPIRADIRLGEWGPRGAVHASVDGRKALVQRGVPGELVAAEVWRGRRPWRGTVREVLEASPARVAPPCPYYALGCGGCQRQHIDYAEQLEIKRHLANREFEAAGVQAHVDVVHGMEDPWRYRRTASIALGWEAGFRPLGRRGIIEIHDCLISHPLIGELAHELNGILREDVLPRYRGKVWLDCTVVGSPGSSALQIVVQGIEGLTLESHPELPDVAASIVSLGNIASVSFRHRSGVVVPLEGDTLSTIEVAGREMFLPAGSFFQTNLAMLEALLAKLDSSVSEREIQYGVDMYAGVGALGLPLASRVGRMALVELDDQAVEAARKTANAWGLDNVNFVSAHAEKAGPAVGGADLIVVDPPRSGLGDAVVRLIADSGARLVLYVSCAPTSLARDLAGLEQSGFRTTSVDLLDFYPQTYHVESLAVVER